MQIVGIVRALDLGDPAKTTMLLLEPGNMGPSAFDQLCQGNNRDVSEMFKSFHDVR